MKKTGMMLIVAAIILNALTPLSEGDSVREEVSRIIELEPCGHVWASGWTPTHALESREILESEWRPAAIVLADEELNRWRNGDYAQEVFLMHHLRTLAYNSHDASENEERLKRAAELEQSLLVAGLRLRRLTALIGATGDNREEALRTLFYIAREAPEESKAPGTARSAWVRLALASEDPVRFKELGDWILETSGSDSSQFIDFCHALWKAGLPPINSHEETVKEVSRWLLSAAEQFKNPASAEDFDRCANGEAFFDRPAMSPDARRLPGLKGWEGSLQRKHLAERFSSPDALPGTRFQARVAAELAADESELTDLREVYGDWAQKAEEE